MLAADDDALLARVAAALIAADYVLIAAGAGFSADSGLPVYADVANAPHWQRLGLDYGDLCRPGMLSSLPACGYGFWSSCMRAYREAAPHEGYALLEKICRTKHADSTCVYTSNVDGHFRRFDRLSARLFEIHGCVEEWCCDCAEVSGAAFQSSPSREEARELDERCRAAIAAIPTPAEVPGLQGLSAVGAVLAAAGPAATAAGTGLPAGELGYGERIAWGALPPRCRACGSALRPAVLMFGDLDAAQLARYEKVARLYQQWEDAAEGAVARSAGRSSLVVLELGCGTRVPSVRLECEAVCRDTTNRGGSALLVRVNPDTSDEAEAADAELPLLRVRATALSTLRRLDALMHPDRT